MTREETLRALADGKRVQYDHPARGWRSPRYPDEAELSEGVFLHDRWRLAPEPVPPGDLTFEEALELYEQGVALEWRYKDWERWAGVTSDINNPGFLDLRRSYAYRRKPTPEPVPSARWRPCDVPPVCWLRSETSRSDELVVAVVEDGVFTRDGFHTFHELADPRWKHSTDRRTWRPCSKEASD